MHSRFPGKDFAFPTFPEYLGGKITIPNFPGKIGSIPGIPEIPGAPIPPLIYYYYYHDGNIRLI